MTACGFPLFVALWNRMQRLETPSVHFVIATFLEVSWERGDKTLLLMAFRSCGKSTLVGLFCVWVLWRNPDLRILVVSADLALAKKMVRNVKRILERHFLTRHLKPDAIDQWGSDRFTVRRNLELRDPSMLAKGVTSNLTGTRADFIICDDVEVPKTSETAQKRAFLRERLLELDYILTPNGTQLYVGTPHCFHTIYADAPREELGEKTNFLYGFKRLVVPVLNASGGSVWPERFPLDRIDAIRKKTGPAHFKSQMLCAPVNISEGYLRPEQMIVYEKELDYREASGRPVLSLNGRKLVSVSAWWDPSFGRDRGDRSVLAIVYTDEDGEYWLHHLALIRVQASSKEDEATQQCRQVAELVARYYLPSIALETNGLGKFLPGILRRELSRKGLSCAVREMTSNKPKSVRILEAFDVVLAARALHVHSSVLRTPFQMEMEDWRPQKSSGHDDCLDAVAGAISLEPVRFKRLTGGKRVGWQAMQPYAGHHDFDV
ncbi:MAG: phage terminase large subunit [Alphaproteobacteria bacterium]|nr:phage terminase large subunit [Alphaproteobacteria bacterium]MCB9985455.1 phage terminase large subunit [Micavibrio sp.]HPQ50308.1 phage terminase large subunit [Alphaproteobacteria bacterium]